MPLRPVRTFSTTIGAVLFGFVAAGCGGAKPEPGTPTPELHPLGGIVGQPMLVTPVQSVRFAPELAWTGLPRNAEVSGPLDSALAATLRVRVANPQWVYADGLAKSFANNPTYATDPRMLSVNALRGRLKVDDRLPEPLASQLRTMIALHEGRLVLIPVELHFDRTTEGAGRPVVRLVLVDPRLSVIRWFGDVTGTDTPAFTSLYLTSIADRVADLFVAK
jgi:hypothetical protein